MAITHQSQSQPRLYLVLRIVSGPDAGRTVEIASGQVVYFGRETSLERTGMIDRAALELSEDQKERVERFLESRGAGESDDENSQSGFRRPRIERFKRLGDVRLTDSTVSRMHALVFVEEGRAGIVDLASTNGTVVNGRKVSAADIRAGDKIELGNVRIEVVGLG